MNDEQWTELHTELQNLMKREIETMRQLLGNLHQEEMLIIRKDMACWNQLMEERARLISQLSGLRQDRQSATETLESRANLSHADASLEELLPQDNENSYELIALRDQMFALLDRMSLQCSRNEMLTQLAQHQPALQPLPQNKSKISIATLSEDDYNNRHAQ